ncbi:MAG: phytoene/squalene synthase family protein, partial [Comamonadaceae bacterium]
FQQAADHGCQPGRPPGAGRLYLPLQWLRDAGIDPEGFLARPRWSAGLASVVRRLLEEADRLYARAGAGVARLPLGCRPGINAARLLYAAIGHQVRANGYDSVAARAVVPRSRKARLLLQAAVAVLPSEVALEQPCLAAGQFLVDAVEAHPPRIGAGAAPSWWRWDQRVDQRAEWTLDLFERLARQDRMADMRRGALP